MWQWLIGIATTALAVCGYDVSVAVMDLEMPWGAYGTSQYWTWLAVHCVVLILSAWLATVCAVVAWSVVKLVRVLRYPETLASASNEDVYYPATDVLLPMTPHDDDKDEYFIHIRIRPGPRYTVYGRSRVVVNDESSVLAPWTWTGPWTVLLHWTGATRELQRRLVLDPDMDIVQLLATTHTESLNQSTSVVSTLVRTMAVYGLTRDDVVVLTTQALQQHRTYDTRSTEPTTRWTYNDLYRALFCLLPRDVVHDAVQALDDPATPIWKQSRFTERGQLNLVDCTERLDGFPMDGCGYKAACVAEWYITARGPCAVYDNRYLYEPCTIFYVWCRWCAGHRYAVRRFLEPLRKDNSNEPFCRNYNRRTVVRDFATRWYTCLIDRCAQTPDVQFLQQCCRDMGAVP